MAEMRGKTMAMPAEGRMVCCSGASGKTADRSSPGRLSWYFAQRSMPGLVYAATMNGYMGSGPYMTKGGKEDV